MKRVVLVGLLAPLLAVSTACALRQPEREQTPASATQEPALNLQLVVAGFTRPVYLTNAGDGSGRLFIVEQAGRVWIMDDGERLPEPFLDIVPLVGSSANEQGLLSLAFHPDYATNGRAFVNYTNLDGDTVVAEYQVMPDDPNRLDPASARTVLQVDQPAGNHNGGLLLFGPDGYLYVGMGDGGGQNGGQNGQRLDTLLGKVLRIDVNAGSPYAIPPDNPFVSTTGARPEIWLTGLRNPWRFSFDAATGDLYLGDVGSASIEEVNVIPPGQGGLNLGWNIFEGLRCNRPDDACPAQDSRFFWPLYTYEHAERECAITGGYVYRGPAAPSLRGVYLFADYCAGTIWGLTRAADSAPNVTPLHGSNLRISSFGLDEAANLYVVDLRGTVWVVRGE